MSRWNEAYEEHGYRQVWNELKEKVLAQEVDDKSIETNAAELGRLQKVTEYLDEQIANLDPELVPLSTWDQFQKQATACLGQVNNFDTNRGIDHVVQANNHADNLLTYIRPYMVLPKDAAKAVKRATTIQLKKMMQEVRDFQEEARGHLASIEGDYKSVTEVRQAAEASAEKFDELDAELFGSDDAQGLKGRAIALVSEIEEQHDEISKLRNVALVGTDESDSLKGEIEAAVAFAKTQKVELEKELSELSSEMEAIRDFHERAFGVETEGGEKIVGMEGKLKRLLDRLEKFETSQSTKYKALVEQIEELLPGATSAGLASAYTTMKESFKDQIKAMTLVFYLCIVTLLGIAFHSSIQKLGGGAWIAFKQYTDWETTLRGVVSRLPMYGPAVWLGYFASKRRSEAQRLQQEYAHKEAVARSYISYKKQIEELQDDNEELRSRLLGAAIDTISRNASTTLDGEHGDKSPSHEVLETVEKWLKDPLLKPVAKRLVGSDRDV